MLDSSVANRFTVRGINPKGKLIEFVMVAESQQDAKQKAEDAGLRFVVVTPAPPDDGVTTEAPTR